MVFVIAGSKSYGQSIFYDAGRYDTTRNRLIHKMLGRGAGVSTSCEEWGVCAGGFG